MKFFDWLDSEPRMPMHMAFKFMGLVGIVAGGGAYVYQNAFLAYGVGIVFVFLGLLSEPSQESS